MDAWHSWRKNAIFTDVVSLGDRTHKVIHVDTISKVEEPVSQSINYVVCNKQMNILTKSSVQSSYMLMTVPQQCLKYVTVDCAESGTKMALDAWHSGKGTARGMKKITTGPKKLEGKTWHPQLTDKSASVKTAVYYQMKNCEGSASQLRASIDNITDHYKGNHSKCLSESRCHLDANYIPSKIQITDPVAEKLLRHVLHELPIYKKAELYANCKDTH